MEEIARGNALWRGCLTGSPGGFCSRQYRPQSCQTTQFMSFGLAVIEFQSPAVAQILMALLRADQLKSKFSLRVSVLATFALFALSELLFNKYV
jgi:hypothetical protein